MKYWGIPRTIISDRDSRFTRKFWTEIFRPLGTQLKFSESLHPQTDGQTERLNALLEEYFRHLVKAHQKKGAEMLDLAQFSYKKQKSSTSKYSPFELATGQQPLTPDA